MKSERWLWIGGWGLPPGWFYDQVKHVYPSAEHTVLPPVPGNVADLDWSHYDRIGGYSLGAFQLLKAAETIPLPVLLVAPFFAFPSEAGLGGRFTRTQVRYLIRWIKRDPLPALEDFYRRAGLDLGKPDTLPYSLDALLDGLDQLADDRIASPGLPDPWDGFVGDADPVVDSNILHELAPRLRIVPGVGHAPEPLLKAASVP